MHGANKFGKGMPAGGPPGGSGWSLLAGDADLRRRSPGRQRLSPLPRAALPWAGAVTITAMASVFCTSAQADPAAPPDLLAAAQRAHPSCRVTLLPGTVRTGMVRGAARPVTIAISEISECYGPGGNASTDDIIAIPADAGSGTAAYVVDQRPLEMVRRAEFANGVIVVDSLSFAPGDPHCCPSRKARVRLVAQGGQLVPLR